MLRNIAICLALALPALNACQPEGDDVDPAEPRAAQVHNGQVITIDLGDAEVDHEQLNEIARAVEDMGDVAQAKVKVKKLDSGTILELELWGGDLPSGDDLESDLRDGFAVLASAEITVASLGTQEAGAGDGLPEDLKDASPGEVEAAVEQRLRNDGVTGDINVNVVDGPNGREVRVNVEKRCTPEDGADCQ